MGVGGGEGEGVRPEVEAGLLLVVLLLVVLLLVLLLLALLLVLLLGPASSLGVAEHTQGEALRSRVACDAWSLLEVGESMDVAA